MSEKIREGKKDKTAKPSKGEVSSAYRARLAKKKDQHVLQSSHGAFKNVVELEAHRIAVTKPVVKGKKSG